MHHLGGTNGSGKSTIYAQAVRLQTEGEFVHADVLARQISPASPEAVSLRPGKQVVSHLDNLLAARRSFVHETTLSSHQSLQVMRRARATGYHVGLIFVVLHSVELNVLRVQERVRMGGHSIPEKDIFGVDTIAHWRTCQKSRKLHIRPPFTTTVRYRTQS